MEKPIPRVIKADNVKLQGSYHVDIDAPAGVPSGTPTKSGTAMSRIPQVRMVENHKDYAVLEITCGCGTKTHVRCEYEMKTN